MALSTQLRPGPYHIPPPRINSMSTAYPSAAHHFGYAGSTGSAPNFPMFASNLHSSSRALPISTTPSSGLSSSISPYLSMCHQLPESPVPLSNDLPTLTENCGDPPNSPLAPNSPDVVDDQESSPYKSCAFNNSSVCSFSETPSYTSSSIATTNGYSAVQNSILNSAPPLSTMSSTLYPQSMFTTPMYSSTVDYSSSFTNGSAASNVWNPYPALPTMAGPLPITSSGSNSMSNYKLSYDSPRYKLTPERAIPLVKWFEEHKEHPYPTRHEKILLCQSTQLTFTQVSTWFANARRRMKKANSEEEESRSNSDDSGSQTSAESSPSNTYEEMLSTAREAI